MKKVGRLLFSRSLFIFIILSISLYSIKSDTVHEINEDVPGTSEYKKVSFESSETQINHFFKYTVTNLPKSMIGALRFDFDRFSPLSILNQVICTFVPTETSDAVLEETLRQLKANESACIGQFNSDGKYNGIVKYDDSKKKLGIYLLSIGFIQFTATVYVRTTEKFLKVEEAQVKDDELYSLIPYTVVISDFRDYCSRILFYSFTRELQMYYAEEKTPYPGKLFSGNIMSVYTNPNMVHQKYHDANYMTLLTQDFAQDEAVSEKFKFQVKFFPSNYLLDYYVSDNTEGRSQNTPLSINMTECENPYYVILNYNQPEKQISLYIDQIYGKVKSLSVATAFNSLTWEEMIVNDMETIRIETRKYNLPKNSKTHMDVYKVECQVPALLNFYYVDETASIPALDYGQVAITTLKAFKSVTLPFVPGIILPELTIEVFNPTKLPFVIVDDGQNENIVDRNSLIRSMPFSTSNPIVIKERDGDSNTRIIVKVGYKTQFQPHSDYVVYNEQLNIYVFSFPNDERRLNYTYANVVTKGATGVDNVKYCYGTNIGSAILPSKENCYRVSETNSYTLKVLNPFVMYRDYDMEEDLSYYVSLKPADNQKLQVTAELFTYDALERNFEGVASKVVIESTGTKSSILSSPKNRDVSIFLQVEQCDNTQLTMKVLNAYNTTETVVPETTVNKGFYKTFNNILLETELQLKGNSGTNVFVKHAGIRSGYNPGVKDSQSITFNSDLNQLIVETPITSYERMKYIVFVSGKGGLSNKGITLCSFTDLKSIEFYNKIVESYNEQTTITINFKKVGLEEGQEFEALVFTEQILNSKLVFLSKIITDKVGKIDEKLVTEIKTVYSDTDYVYANEKATPDGLTYYFSFLPSEVFDVPFGAFNIELESVTSGFSNVDCAFVDDGEDAISMVEAVEDIIESRNPYCIGGRSTINERLYRYIFKYSYTKDNKPRRLVIKISNGLYTSSDFSVYVRKVDNVYLEPTDFSEQREYGKQEEYKKSVVPYIVDLEAIRKGVTEENYISKILIFSKFLEMQMYYLDEETNAPKTLFTGNIMLVLTKPDLAIQKYHSTKLILLSENLNGQEHSSLGNQFRFHTKMFKTDDQIEYFVSNNPTGRTLNYPLSLEMNICNSTNNKYYYILNYNKAEEERILYLDVVYGSIKNARIANEITEEKWDSLTQIMSDIKDYTVTLPSKSQHIDIVEIECNSPLLANVYYNYEGQIYNALSLGEIAVQNLKARESTKITIDTAMGGTFYFSISLFNPIENPDISFSFGDGKMTRFTENTLHVNVLFNPPESISFINNGETTTRFIFKIGYGPESGGGWIIEDEDIEGTLYSKDNKFIYKFPSKTNRRNFTDVSIIVKPLKKEDPNVKFCYSTSYGMPIDVSMENCFRTGANIYYTMNFINPLIALRNYKSNTENYYVTLSPFYYSEFISLEISEQKYETNVRNIEGIGKIININQGSENSTILTLPENIANTNLLLQLQLCSSTGDEIIYKVSNSYNHEEIVQNTLSKLTKLYYYPISYNLMESELKFIGQTNDIIFAKHIGFNNYQIQIQPYQTSFEKTENVAIIDKPILNEAFNFTVIVGKKERRLDTYTLCTFAEKTVDEYKKLGDYVNTFTSVSSNTITHFIDFKSCGYNEGDEFDLLVYALQLNNTKLEFLYDVITATVGKVVGVIKLDGQIEGKPDYFTKEFIKNTTSNYLCYQYTRYEKPAGDVFSLKIRQKSDEESSEGMRITKVGCTFVNVNADDEEMIKSVNNAMNLGLSVCIGESQKDTNGFDALISAKDISSGSNNKKLVIQVIYGLGDDENKKKNDNLRDGQITLNATLRISGYNVKTYESEYAEEEELTLVPYVLDLLEIRGKEDKYTSKVLLYSNTREMQMYYISNNGAPKELFSGNIMLLYTNEELIKEKYFGATTMILVTDSFSSTQKTYFGEQFRFKTNFFDSKSTIQYYVSANPSGRLLNNPTAIEMLSCDQPYYYILNYHFFEPKRTLHIDKIFGEIDTIKIATQLTENNWYDFIKNLEKFEGNEYSIEAQDKFHIDVIEVTCKIPLLLNVYYTDPAAPKKTNLDEGDVSIISLFPGTSETLTFKLGLSGDFIYSFNVWRENSQPNIAVLFEDHHDLEIKQNGIFLRETDQNFYLITIKNNVLSGGDQTKVIFKFGYVIEKTFTKIENDMYNLQTNDSSANLFAYIFENGEDRLNYTKVDFLITTEYDNVKFCYISNLGAFIDPSLQNCYRVGSENPYTISVLNPYVMYKDYYTGEDIMKYYVSFRTEEKELNIIIKPTLTYYPTKIRNDEGYPKSLTLENDEISTILSAPSSNTQYLFIQMHVCTRDKAISYNFSNAYNNTPLKEQGDIPVNSYNNYRNINNTHLDTLLTFKNLVSKEDDKVKIFVKHIGTNQKYYPVVGDFKISFNKGKREISFTQPLLGEEMKYTLYLDKKDNFRKQEITLCTIAELNKIGHYSQSFEGAADKENVTQTIDFNKAELKGYESFDLIILAQQKNNGQFMVLSDVYSGNINGSGGGETSNRVFVVIIIILSIILIVGGVLVFLFLRSYSNRKPENMIIAKPTNLDDIQASNKGEKMLDSMAQSQAYENQK